MISSRGAPLTGTGLALVLSAIAPERLLPQGRSALAASKDSVTVVAHGPYDAGALKRFFLGDNYRDLWAMPIKVPVLGLRSYAGGLRPTKLGGGRQTKTLRFVAPDSSEYVFRPVFKPGIDLPDEFKGTIIWNAILDARSSAHPLGPVAMPPLLAAARVIGPSPRAFVMPNDPLLGEFRKEFGGVLGTIEGFPDASDGEPGFRGAVEVIDSDELLERIDRDPQHQVDTRALLTARLVDMLLNDNDRHAGQWKWARLRPGGDWLPVPRDRDKVFVNYQGLLLDLARIAVPSTVAFENIYPPLSGLFENAVEFDRRLLAGVERPVWDSVANWLRRRITDQVIDEVLRTMPREFAASSREISVKLQARRDGLPAAAREYYDFLAEIADIHATDSDERARVVRSAEGLVDVIIQSGGKPPHFIRRFDARETGEIRLYLHGGNDVAIVTGSAQESIPVRIIGGNGNNTLVDSSSVGGRRNPTYLYEAGSVDWVRYEPPEVTKKKAEDDAGELFFNRRPWVRKFGRFAPPERDRGGALRPVVGLRTGHGLGIVPKIGVTHYKYAFRRVPYASMMRADVAYSPAIKGFDIGVTTDKRFESSTFHVPVTARMTQLEIVEFRGFGNDVPNLEGTFYDVRQRQWIIHPAAALSLGTMSEVSLGPIVRYTVTDSAVNRFISQQRPYGAGEFGQAGVQLKLYYDTRKVLEAGRARGGFDVTGNKYSDTWATLDFRGSVYPKLWDAEDMYEDVSAVVSAFLTLPVLTRPVLALRAGGKKLFGDFPYFDAAFIGGSGSLRTERRQRFAGDASLFGTTELRVPIARFPFFLPLDVGALGFVDLARVYVNGDSPGGWHNGAGAGFWVGVAKPETGVTVMATNNPDRRLLVTLGFAF